MRQDYRIAAVDKALDILECLGRQRNEQSLPELSRALDMPKVTVFRYVATLEGRGYVRKGPNDRYSLGLRLLQLSHDARSNLTVHEVALPVMRSLVDRFQETVNLAVLDGCDVVNVEILESPQAFRMSSHVGGRDPLHSTSLGKALLAFLPDAEVRRIVLTAGLPRRTARTICCVDRLGQELELVRQRGYAVDDQENEEGARCVGAPVLDHRRYPIAALSVSGPAFRLPDDKMAEIGVELVEVASLVSQQVGYHGRA